MKDQINRYVRPLTEFWQGLSSKAKKWILLSGGGCVLLAVGLGLVLNSDPYTALYSDISAAETAEIAQKLDALGVEYRTGSGTVEVKEKQADEVKMRLAIEGYPKSGLTYDVFTNNIDLMSTDFEKNSYKIFQLQDRLRDTIKLISGVEDAVVTIAVPQQNNYVWKEDEAQASASVVLKTATENAVSQKQVQGIVQLVSKSIPGLSAENVAVVDNFGNDLVSSAETLSEVSLSQLKLDIEKQIETSSKTKITHLLVPIYGEENVRISVKCVVDINRKVTESINYIPNGDTDRGVLEKEQTNQESTVEGNTDNSVPGTESNTEVPTYPLVSENGDTVYVKDQNSYEYLVSSIKEQIQADGSEQKELTVAVAVNNASLTAAEKADLQRLVAAAAAIDPEKVVVHGTVFEANKNNTITLPGAASGENLMLFGLILLVVVAVFVLLLAVILHRAKRKRLREEEERKAREAAVNAAVNHLEARKAGEEKVNPFAAAAAGSYRNLNTLNPTDQQMLQKNLQEFTDENPEIVAKLLRSWLKGEEGKIE